tara:strand:- start:794 stop:943 length:150 start_codon:yes stop_codon:yes gene_type:complete
MKATVRKEVIVVKYLKYFIIRGKFILKLFLIQGIDFQVYFPTKNSFFYK